MTNLCCIKHLPGEWISNIPNFLKLNIPHIQQFLDIRIILDFDPISYFTGLIFCFLFRFKVLTSHTLSPLLFDTFVLTYLSITVSLLLFAKDAVSLSLFSTGILMQRENLSLVTYRITSKQYFPYKKPSNKTSFVNKLNLNKLNLNKLNVNKFNVNKLN